MTRKRTRQRERDPQCEEAGVNLTGDRRKAEELNLGFIFGKGK